MASVGSCDTTSSRSLSRPTVAYDLDGTLLEASHRQVALASHHLRAAGAQDLDEVAFWEAKRAGSTTREALVGLGYGSKLAAMVSEAWSRDVEDDTWQSLDEWLPGARTALTRVRAAGFAAWVLTARRDPAAVARHLSALGALSQVDRLIVVSPSRAADEKAPHLTAAVAFIGDTESDLAAARMAEVPFIGVTSGLRSATRLTEAGATQVVADVATATNLVIQARLTTWDAGQ